MSLNGIVNISNELSSLKRAYDGNINEIEENVELFKKLYVTGRLLIECCSNPFLFLTHPFLYLATACIFVVLPTHAFAWFVKNTIKLTYSTYFLYSQKNATHSIFKNLSYSEFKSLINYFSSNPFPQPIVTEQRQIAYLEEIDEKFPNLSRALIKTGVDVKLFPSMDEDRAASEVRVDKMSLQWLAAKYISANEINTHDLSRLSMPIVKAADKFLLANYEARKKIDQRKPFIQKAVDDSIDTMKNFALDFVSG